MLVNFRLGYYMLVIFRLSCYMLVIFRLGYFRLGSDRLRDDNLSVIIYVITLICYFICLV